MDSIIVCRNSQGLEVRATPLRMSRHAVVFEVYNPYSIVQLSEVLGEFKIIMNDHVIYSGRAVVSNLVNTGIMLVCEASLDGEWLDVDLLALVKEPQKLHAGFAEFIKGWEKIHFVLPDYKVVIADIQNFLVDLRCWLEQLELGIRSQFSDNKQEMESELIHKLAPTIISAMNGIFQRFEEVAEHVDGELGSIHRTYAKRQLHPQLLCSPFAYRTYHKPLGYAGDYEMVNMILRDPLEGSSLFAKTVNLWLLSQAPAVAHRNRVKYLTEVLVKETNRVAMEGRWAHIFNLGCGPAEEIQNFLSQRDSYERVSFTLLDFNDETLQYTGKALENLKHQYRRRTPIRTVKKSVHQILKETVKPHDNLQKYDLIYCAGLFDYFSDRICKRLLNIFYDMLESGGLLLATNVNLSNPYRNSMDFVLEWHLFHRSRAQLQRLCPDQAPQSSYNLKSEATGVNIFIEVRKPQ